MKLKTKLTSTQLPRCLCLALSRGFIPLLPSCVQRKSAVRYSRDGAWIKHIRQVSHLNTHRISGDSHSGTSIAVWKLDIWEGAGQHRNIRNSEIQWSEGHAWEKIWQSNYIPHTATVMSKAMTTERVANNEIVLNFLDALNFEWL